MPRGPGQGRPLGLFHKEISMKGTESARGSDRKSTRRRDLWWFFFSFNGKLTPGFNAVMLSSLEMRANKAFCFLCII